MCPTTAAANRKPRSTVVVAGEGKRHTFLLVSQRFSSASEQAMSQFGYGPKLRHWVLLGWSARCAGLHGTHDYVLNGVSVRRLILALWLNERSWKQTGWENVVNVQMKFLHWQNGILTLVPRLREACGLAKLLNRDNAVFKLWGLNEWRNSASTQ